MSLELSDQGCKKVMGHWMVAWRTLLQIQVLWFIWSSVHFIYLWQKLLSYQQKVGSDFNHIVLLTSLGWDVVKGCKLNKSWFAVRSEMRKMCPFSNEDSVNSWLALRSVGTYMSYHRAGVPGLCFSFTFSSSLLWIIFKKQKTLTVAS